MDDQTTAHLAQRFGLVPPEVLGQLQSMLRIYNIDPSELFFKWESYSMKMNFDADVKLTLELARDFKKDVQDLLEREVRGGRIRRGPEQQAPGAGKRVVRQRVVKMEGGAGDDVFGLFDTPAKATGTKRKYERAPHETPAKAAKTHMNDGPQTPLAIRTPLRPVSGKLIP